MFSEDLSAFFNTADFALAALYNGAATVSVIFDSAYLTELGIAGTNPIALGKAADFPAAAAVGKTLVISGVSYTIRDRQPQDDGACVLLQLEKQ